MGRKGYYFSMFSKIIRLCVGLKFVFFQANGIVGFGGRDFFSNVG